MKCTFCKLPAPADPDALVDEGWIPSYYDGDCEIEGPICPDCCQEHLDLSDCGEWEIRPHTSEAHRWN